MRPGQSHRPVPADRNHPPPDRPIVPPGESERSERGRRDPAPPTPLPESHDFSLVPENAPPGPETVRGGLEPKDRIAGAIA